MSGLIATYTDSSNLSVRPLIMLLKDFVKQGAPNPIPEIVYRNQISKNGIVPDEVFYSRAIITYTHDRYWAVIHNVRSDGRFWEGFYCQYHEDGRKYIHEFSNIMPLYADIIILQYINTFFHSRRDYPLLIRALKFLMINKYKIQYEDVYCNGCKGRNCKNIDCLNYDPTKITIGRICRSFVSVMLWFINYIPYSTNIVRSVFPYSHLPSMIYSSYFPLILSRRIGLDYKYLLAMNLAICAAVQKKLSISSLYDRLVRTTFSFDVYTEDIRIDICIKLGIVINRDDKYFFPRILEKHRSYCVIAKDKIRRMREHDKTLVETIEEMNKLLL